MDQTVRDYVVEQTHRLMEAFSCSGEAKEAAQAWLAALGTDREAEETRKYVQELEEDRLCRVRRGAPGVWRGSGARGGGPWAGDQGRWRQVL